MNLPSKLSSMSSRIKYSGLFILLSFMLLGVWVVDNGHVSKSNTSNIAALPANLNRELTDQFKTDFSKNDLNDFINVISGGPSKDVIPSIDRPKFRLLTNSDLPDNARGVLVEIDGDARFYPYNILTWHEIVNDEFNSKPIAVTFCPLCGTAIVYDREIDGQILTFGVSGFLRESNMIMFDRSSESFWQQSTGKSFAGDHSGRTLTKLPFQLLTVENAKLNYPEAEILSKNTGAERDYDNNPYSGYEDSDRLYFDVSITDRRFKPKELFYIFESDGSSVAIKQEDLINGATTTFELAESKYSANRKDGMITVVNESTNEEQVGYYEMWFSWATWHQDDGEVWVP